MGRLKITVDYDWAGANASYQRAVELEPGNPEGVILAALSAACFGRFDEALQLARRAVDLDPLNAGSWEALAAPYRAELYALAYYALGRKKESDAALRELTMKYHASNAFEIARIFACRNQTDEAFEWLDRAYAQRDPSLMSTKMDPLLKSLHNDPRFAALLKKLNLPN
jgi:tetratricopeptide (TPR) repeat protein